MFFLFSSRLGCLGSLLVSAVLTVLLFSSRLGCLGSLLVSAVLTVLLLLALHVL